MNKFHLSKKAKVDIDKIYLFTAQNWSLKHADTYFDLIQKQMQFAADNPEIGRIYPYKNSKYRGIKIKSHIVFYTIIKETEIKIVRILHQKMDIESKLEN